MPIYNLNTYVQYLKKSDLDEFINYNILNKRGIIEYLLLADIELQDIAYTFELCNEKVSYQVLRKSLSKN